MLKRILGSVGVLVVGFVLVVGLVYLELRAIIGIIEIEGTQRIPIYREAVKVRNQADDVRSAVARGFLAVREGDLDQIRTNVSVRLKDLQDSLQILTSPAFKPAHASPVVFTGLPSDVTNGFPRNIGSLLQAIRINQEAFAAAALRSIELAKTQMANRTRLSQERLELERSFRGSLEAQTADPAGFQVMARGVLTVLHSASIQDLNFAGRTRFNEGLKALRKVQTETSKPLLDDVESRFGKAFETAAAVLASGADFQGFEAHATSLQIKIGALTRTAETEFDAGQAHLGARSDRTAKLSLAISCICMVTGIGIAIWIALRLTRQLAGVVRDVNEGATQVGVASGQLSSVAATLRDGAHGQATAVEQASVEIKDVAALARQNTANVQKAVSLTAQAKSSAEECSRRVTQMHESMESIETASQDVSKIIKTINEIALQTNLLALNAAVEAARAGEAGLGFAVVADEVRNLSQRCSAAAAETCEKIENASRRTKQGLSIAKQVGESLAAMMVQVKDVDAVSVEISAASDRQSQALESVQRAVDEIHRISQDNSSCAEEFSGSAGQLRQQAADLKDATGNLENLVGRASIGSTPRSHQVGTRQPNQQSGTNDLSPSASNQGLHASSSPLTHRHRDELPMPDAEESSRQTTPASPAQGNPAGVIRAASRSQDAFFTEADKSF